MLREGVSIDRSGGAAATRQKGLGNELESEAIAGALPEGQNSPRQAPLGLISELVSGTTFSAPRAFNRRTYVFRVRPSVLHSRFEPVNVEHFLTPPLHCPPSPNQLRWSPREIPASPIDFLDGVATICGNGSPELQTGCSIHVYVANRSMERFFLNADGEMLVIGEQGAIEIRTELGALAIGAGEIAVIPRGVKFKVDVLDGPTRGFICENYGLPFRLPELGLIGSNGLANAIDFEIPGAAYEVSETPSILIQKFAGRFWQAELPHSPLDVVAWRGNYLPCKFDMRRFVALGTATVDHPDPSIYCALTSPGDSVLGGNADFMVLPPRWLVAEHSFRPPGYHRNCVGEYLGIITGQHDGKAKGFQPGGASLHNHWAAHGPDNATFQLGRNADEQPRKVDSLVFMIESRLPFQLSRFAAETPELQRDYLAGWQDFQPLFGQAN